MNDSNRKNTHNGGVCVWLKKDSKFSVLATQTIDEIPNLQAILVILRGNIKIFAFYRSPNQSLEELQRTTRLLEKLDSKTCIVGDLNIDADWEEETTGPTNNRAEKIELITKIGKEAGRKQIVDFPTNMVNQNFSTGTFRVPFHCLNGTASKSHLFKCLDKSVKTLFV